MVTADPAHATARAHAAPNDPAPSGTSSNDPANVSVPANALPSPKAVRRTAGPLSRLGRDLLVLTTLAVAARLLVHNGLPLPLATTTLLLAMLVGTLLRRWFDAALVSFEAPLSCGMVLLGVQFVPGQLDGLGATAPLWLCGYWLLVGAVFLGVVRLGLLPARTGGLLAIGLGGAGISAVRAAARVDERLPRDAVPLVTAVVLVAGAIGFLAAGAIAARLELSAPQLACWVGVCMPTTAEAVLVGAGHSDAAQQLTAGVRLWVNLLQFVPIVAYVQRFVPDGERPQRRRIVAVVLSTLRRVPLFVWGLALVGAFAWHGAFTPAERDALRALTNWTFLLALAGIGCNTRPRDLWRIGPLRIALLLLLWALTAGLLLVVVCAVA